MASAGRVIVTMWIWAIVGFILTVMLSDSYLTGLGATQIIMTLLLGGMATGSTIAIWENATTGTAKETQTPATSAKTKRENKVGAWLDNLSEEELHILRQRLMATDDLGYDIGDDGELVQQKRR